MVVGDGVVVVVNEDGGGEKNRRCDRSVKEGSLRFPISFHSRVLRSSL